jgi:histidine ammonia-lyase
MLLLASAQAVDLRGGPSKLGGGSRQVYDHVREVAAFQDKDRPMEEEVARVTARIFSGELTKPPSGRPTVL